MTDTNLTAGQAFDLADELMEAATAAFRRRRDTPGLSDAQFDELSRQETALRYDSDRYRAVGVRLLANDGAVTAQSLKDQVASANRALGNIKKVRNTLTILAAVVEFGAAIATGNVRTILAAGKKVNQAVRAANKDEKDDA